MSIIVHNLSIIDVVASVAVGSAWQCTFQWLRVLCGRAGFSGGAFLDHRDMWIGWHSWTIRSFGISTVLVAGFAARQRHVRQKFT